MVIEKNKPGWSGARARLADTKQKGSQNGPRFTQDRLKCCDSPN
jgi:hypothetical protein